MLIAGKSDEDENTEEKSLAISVVCIKGLEPHALMEAGATPNIFSPRVMKKLSLKPENSSKMVTVATGDQSGAVGELTSAPVMIDDLHAKVYFINLRTYPSMWLLDAEQSRE